MVHRSSATNRLITSKDHASVQLNVGHLDQNGVYTGHFSTFALCGYIRAQVCDSFYIPAFLRVCLEPRNFFERKKIANPVEIFVEIKFEGGKVCS